MTDLPDAEDVSYWQTSKSGPDTWLERTAELIEQLGGTIYTHAFGKDDQGNSAYMLQFKIGEDAFKLVWPVLHSRTGKDMAAKRQAATLLYHDVKAKCLTARILGSRTAFFGYLLLPDGRTAAAASIPELMEDVPLALAGYSHPQNAPDSGE